MNWQPIKTAPRDGTNILLRFGVDGVSQGKFVPGGVTHPWKFIDTQDGITWLINHAVDGPGGPSHWQPMPSAIRDTTPGVAAVPAPKREQREVPPGKWKVDMPDGAYGRMPGDPPGPASVRAVIGGYVYDVAPRTGKLQASEVPRGVDLPDGAQR
jgi:hypothetical protein